MKDSSKHKISPTKFKPSDEESEPCFLVAQDAIVLDLTMQCLLSMVVPSTLEACERMHRFLVNPFVHVKCSPTATSL